MCVCVCVCGVDPAAAQQTKDNQRTNMKCEVYELCYWGRCGCERATCGWKCVVGAGGDNMLWELVMVRQVSTRLHGVDERTQIK